MNQPTEAVEVTLLPCPFCNASCDMLKTHSGHGSRYAWIECTVCECEGPTSTLAHPASEIIADASEKWNTRLASPARQGDREAVVTQADRALYEEARKRIHRGPYEALYAQGLTKDDTHGEASALLGIALARLALQHDTRAKDKA